MRPPRIAILAFFFSASLFLFCRSLALSTRTASAPYPTTKQNRKSVWGVMYYNTPFSLFPPNAAISLTDDNSTSFAARPAAFGPKLAEHGLSGQLWVGSGFPEDSLDSDGELGCSDLPGWDGGNTRAALKNSFKTATPRISTSGSQVDHHKRATDLLDPDHRDAISISQPKTLPAPLDDGTDNYLTQEISGKLGRHDSAASASHADIQSLQEAAEIQGKIVLLKRGGCGFLEKVMWAQRRGASAVIVGDNQKGGPLIQMFAHGEEVDNITIPSVFTARTTAHLLSSLTQPGSFIEDTLDDSGNPVLKVQQGLRAHDTTKTTAASPKSTSASTKTGVDRTSSKESWVSRVFRWRESFKPADEKSRPPTSGQLDWVMVEDWNEEKDEILSESIKKPKSQESEDDFHIGVQDWRDPDFADKAGSTKSQSTSKVQSSKSHAGSKNLEKSPDAIDPARKIDPNGPKGGSITPSSGEYRPEKLASKDSKFADELTPSSSRSRGKGLDLLYRMFGHEDPQQVKAPVSTDKGFQMRSTHEHKKSTPEPHEGLWVTITPTSSASPLFDTLLVLVISPLVTLTIVYALLIIRARLRRRRWRAPKSVVERLPVRTYHTVASTSPDMSPRLPSPATATVTPTTPLLQSSQSRSRPRSRTTTGVPESPNLLGPGSATPPARPLARHENGASTEWRKYMGRQVECVVCLEEYVDGVSKVMSLPCGHEFHVDCITPWLTTRRRTCPICKGDVVRSMARGSPSGPRYEAYRDDSDDDLEAAGSAERSSDLGSDDELVPFSSRALSSSDERSADRGESWFGLFSSSLGSRSRSPPSEDRDR